jgi:hypothetical protein
MDQTKNYHIKKVTLIFLLIGWIFISPQKGWSQTDSTLVKIVKTEGGFLVGNIINQDEREVYLKTEDGRNIYIPQHSIKSIELLDRKFSAPIATDSPKDHFATRYFITTNGLSLKRGENYVLWNLFGPDFQFGIRDNFTLGIMTSWIGIPIIGTIKKSFSLGENTHFALGGLVGTGSWVLPDFGGLLPFASLTFGNEWNKISFSGGYGAIWQENNLNGRFLSNVAGTVRISDKISLVFDSFILIKGKDSMEEIEVEDYVFNPTIMDYEWVTRREMVVREQPGIAILIPGVRWHQGSGKAFQIGFSGLISDGEAVPLPIPMVQWFRSL